MKCVIYQKRVFFSILFLTFCAFGARAAEKKSFQMVAIEANGTKVWVPSVIVVYEGDDVEIQAVSKVPSPNTAHGLHLPDFNILEVIEDKPKVIAFKAKKAGVFPIRCHLHAAHIGGQLVVMKRK